MRIRVPVSEPYKDGTDQELVSTRVKSVMVRYTQNDSCMTLDIRQHLGLRRNVWSGTHAWMKDRPLARLYTLCSVESRVMELILDPRV